MAKGSYITKSPAVIPGLLAWYDAADASTIDASSVSEWKDKSGNNNHATQTTASLQPTSGTNTINGHNSLYYDGNPKTLTTPIVITDEPFYVFYVYEKLVLTSEYHIVYGNSFSMTGGSGKTNIGFNDNEVRISSYSTGADYLRVGPSLSVSTPTIISHLVTGKNGTVSYRVNGSEKISGSAGNNDSAATFSIGIDLANRNLNGNLGEIIHYNNVLSTADVALIEQYLANKWAISI